MTTTEAETALMTADDLLRLSGEGVRGELIRGVLWKTMPAGGEHGEVAMRLGRRIADFVETRGIGRVTGTDAGVRLEEDPDTVREPDLAFISAARLPLNVRVTGYYEVVPDVIVEVFSPSDRVSEFERKALMWLRHGARLVWAVRPDTRTVDVYRDDGSTLTLAEGDALDGLDVLPGFTCPLADVFPEYAARDD